MNQANDSRILSGRETMLDVADRFGTYVSVDLTHCLPSFCSLLQNVLCVNQTCDYEQSPHIAIMPRLAASERFTKAQEEDKPCELLKRLGAS